MLSSTTTGPTRANRSVCGYWPTRDFSSTSRRRIHLPMFQVERWFQALTTKYLQRSVHHNVTELNEGITQRAEAANKKLKPFISTTSANDVLASMQKYPGPIISD